MTYVIPVFIALVLIIAFIKKVTCYDTFADGAMEGLKFAFTVFPYLAAMFVFIELSQYFWIFFSTERYNYSYDKTYDECR